MDMPLALLLGKPPKMLRDAHHQPVRHPDFHTAGIDPADAAYRVLQLPAVAAKTFLITIGDRSVTGLVTRDQMVGPWQVPVADVAVTSTDYHGYRGEAMAMGERTPVALVDGPASGRLAVGEAITNIAAAAIDDLGRVRLSANWMAAAGHPGEDAALFDTVQAVGAELCPALGIAIPVGKDSLSMRTVWEQDDGQHAVTAPLSLIISAFAPVSDVRRTLTPQLRTDRGDSDLVLIDLGKGHNRLAGSALAQVYKQVGHRGPDLDDPGALKAFFSAVQDLNGAGLVLAYHDRSDGGLFATLCEMAFAGGTGLTVQLDDLGDDPIAALFTEELGAVLQVRHADTDTVLETLREAGLGRHCHVIGRPTEGDRIVFTHDGRELLAEARVDLHRAWARTSYSMQALRVEMAAAFHRAGFQCRDVHMSDILSGRVSLEGFSGLAACGGFSYGDVLGAGQGWAKSILFNARARDQFAAFFARDDTFGLGVCNGCQMMAGLTELLPGADLWPQFVRNASEQFEARTSLVEIVESPSILLAGMAGSRMPIAVAHGEGRALFATPNGAAQAEAAGQVALRYVDGDGRPTEAYPANPNGSPGGLTGLTTRDGRFTIMMPHPERVFRAVQNSWRPDAWAEDGPWMRMFRNARVWLG
ncbi:MAG: phosphoribosylformylglycinamidine synthase subunit PurQ [Gammaproteobacteria bacterium]